MDFPKISIITVVFNSVKLLNSTIESVKELNYPNIEYIIVDGNSTDGTRGVIEKNYLSITRWISEPDRGIYDAMNKGISLATGDYIWFINAGDRIYDTDVLLNIFHGSEELYDVYYGDTIITDEEGEVKGLRRKRLPRRLSWSSFKRGMTVCHQSIIVRRDVAVPYDLSYRFSADFDWVINILKNKSVTTLNTKMILSEFQEGGATTKNRVCSLKERWGIMVKHYGYASTIVSHISFLFNIFGAKYRKVKLLKK